MEEIREIKLQPIMDRLRDRARRKVPEFDVEDLVQDAMVVFVERLRKGSIETHQAYADGILRHMIYDYYQKRREHTISLENSIELESSSPSPEDRVTWMRQLRVVEGVAKENRVDQAIVKEHFVGGAPLREVATRLGVSAGVVNGRLYRFRQKLSKRVGNGVSLLLALFVGLWGRFAQAWVSVRVYSTASWMVGVLSLGTVASWNFFYQEQPKVEKVKVKKISLIQKKIYFAVNHVVAPEDVSFEEEHQNETYQQFAHSSLSQQYEVENVSFQEEPRLVRLSEKELEPKRLNPIVFRKKISQRVLKLEKTFPFFSYRLIRTVKAKGSLLSISGTTFQEAANAQPSSKTRTKTKPTIASKQKQKKRQGSKQGHSSKPSQGNPKVDEGRLAENRRKIDQTIPKVLQNDEQDPRSHQGARLAQKSLLASASLKHEKASSSFCAVQNGRMYRCTNGKMFDLTTKALSSFSCGSNALCKNLSKDGVALLFKEDGTLLLVGEGIYGYSTDKGHSWNAPVLPPSPMTVMKGLWLAFRHDGSLLRKEKGDWVLLRKQDADLHEVRLRLDGTFIQIEDDGGFRVSMSWHKESISLTVEGSPLKDHVTGAQSEALNKALSAIKGAMNEALKKNPLGENIDSNPLTNSKKPIPISKKSTGQTDMDKRNSKLNKPEPPL